VDAISMTEPTEDEILMKAEELAYEDGKLWDTAEIEGAPAERNRFVDDALRAEYLNRALELQKGKRRSEPRARSGSGRQSHTKLRGPEGIEPMPARARGAESIIENATRWKNAAHWRARSEEIRSLAGEANDSAVKAMMLRIAADYSRLAKWAEQREKSMRDSSL
jgi:hypothetical protein